MKELCANANNVYFYTAKQQKASTTRLGFKLLVYQVLLCRHMHSQYSRPKLIFLFLFSSSMIRFAKAHKFFVCLRCKNKITINFSIWKCNDSEALLVVIISRIEWYLFSFMKFVFKWKFVDLFPGIYSIANLRTMRDVFSHEFVTKTQRNARAKPVVWKIKFMAEKFPSKK